MTHEQQRFAHLGHVLEQARKQPFLIEVIEDLRKSELPVNDLGAWLADLIEALEMRDGGIIDYPLTDEGQTAYEWCLHCERAETAEKWNAATKCPYADCDGTVLDRWGWERAREDINGDLRYPEVPEIGKVYPLN
jgi:hypothetical protein